MTMAYGSPVSRETDNHGEGYVVVDLPLRLTPGELARLTGVSVKPLGKRPSGAMAPADPRIAAARDRAAEILAMRREREELLGVDIFGEPAWDLLLDLFIQHVDGQRTNSKSAAMAARAPTSTAMRYLNILVDTGLVIKAPSPHDLRVQYVTISPRGYNAMLNLLQHRN